MLVSVAVHFCRMCQSELEKPAASDEHKRDFKREASAAAKSDGDSASLPAAAALPVVTISDYAQFCGADAAAVLTALQLARSPAEVAALKLAFPSDGSDATAASAAGAAGETKELKRPAASASPSASAQAVTLHNRHAYVERKMQHDLFGCRLKQLRAFRRGFFSLPEVIIAFCLRHLARLADL
jgi:hypothetical protein